MPKPPKLLAGLLLAVLAACSPNIVSTAGSDEPATEAPAGPSGLPASPATPTASPSSTVMPSPGVGLFDLIAPGSAIKVSVLELNLRSRPATSAKRLKILKKGAVLIVSPTSQAFNGFGPVRSGGYAWYPVILAQRTGPASGLPELPESPILYGTEVETGWVATDDGSKAFVKSLPPRCPAVVDLASVQGMLPAERLACFSGSITLEGTYGCGGCGGSGSIAAEPAWLADMLDFDFLSVKPSDQIGPLTIHFPPGGPTRPDEGTILRVAVHVDDPAAASCRLTDVEPEPDSVLPIPTTVFMCRERFVVDSYEVLGTDPTFPG